MNYEQLDPNLVWDMLGNGEVVVGVVLDNTGQFEPGAYDANDLTVNTVIELINENNTVFFKHKED